MPFGIGYQEILLVLAVGFLFFGGPKIASFGRDLGKGLRDFKRGIVGQFDDEEEKGENKKS